MRRITISNCERDFIYQSFVDGARTDGRTCAEYRYVNICLGKDRGSALVSLGNTKVFAQVSSSIAVPKSGRNVEGALRVNLEMSPMASQHFESGRLGEAGVEISRVLERTLVNSRCVDLESLCIVAGEQAWEIRIDVHVLDNDGSIVDCASIAAICALRHFRRPDVTVAGESVTVHSESDKEPIPLNMYHYPVCVTFGFCDRGNVLIVDPTEQEEQVIDGKVVVAMNSHREICAMHCSGSTLFKKDQILRCASKAVTRAQELTETINSVFESDNAKRSSKLVVGFMEAIGVQRVTGARQPNEIREITMPSTASKSPPENADKLDGSTTLLPEIKRKGKVMRVAKKPVTLPTEPDSQSDVEMVEEVVTDIRKPNKQPDEIVISDKKSTESKLKEKRRGKAKIADKDVSDLLDEIDKDVQVLLPGDSGYKVAAGFSAEDNIETIDLTTALKSKNKPKRTQK